MNHIKALSYYAFNNQPTDRLYKSENIMTTLKNVDWIRPNSFVLPFVDLDVLQQSSWDYELC